MVNQHTSTSMASHCCEYHDKKYDKNCKTQEMAHILHLPTIHEIGSQPCGSYCGVILYIILAVMLLGASIIELVVTIGSYILTKDLHEESPGRLAGMVLLALCAAIIVISVFFAVCAIRSKDRITLQTVSTIIAILVVVEILVVIFAVSIKKADNDTLESALTDSFLLAVDEEDDATIKKWNIMQSMYECCGLIGPDDYIVIPSSCCPPTNSSSQFTNKWHREVCVINKSYHKNGCVGKANTVFRMTVQYMSIASLVFIVLEVLLSTVGFYLVRKSNPVKNNPPPLTNKNMLNNPPE